ncbi:Protein EXECUTER 1, chloroplastic [Auxenochlorella protothecoides]|uniref:Protein EXECUTER 1, chloroplastic n=1 Tax=Auxenochlorella protothecoides TaxID=3075 RepID=A0A087SA47_AUXPR|nr:Protein EXECUTER 1, chloroplastic [Auxenochlorella protothecoides]KFM22601.1 Protein EXECUTER 1, chloroplastic [Auxenochlorella protothecoides]
MPGVRLKNPTVGNPPASPPRTRTCRHARVVRACHAAPDSGGRHRDPFPRTSIPGSTHAPPQKAREVGAGVDNSVDQAPAAAQAALTPATASDLEEDADWQDWKAVMARTHSLAEAHEEACAALDSSVALDAYAAAAALRDRLAGIRAQDCLGEALAELDRAVAAERYAAAASLRDMAWAGLPGWWSGRGDRGDVAGHLIRVSRRYGHYAAHAFSGRDLAAALGWAPDAVFEYVSLGGGDEDGGAGEADPGAQAVLEMHFRRGAGGALEAQAVAVLGPAEAEEVESADGDELAEVVVAVQGVEAEAALRTTGAMEQVLKAVAKQLEGAVDGVDGEVWSALQSALAAVAAKRERDARALRALRYNIPVHAEVGPDRVSFRRIRAPRGDALAGVYLGQFGPHGPEVVQLARSRRDGDEWVHATKITGDRNVPAGELSFKARVGREHRLPTAVEGYPPELGVTARYAGRGRVAEPGFKNPRWVNAELLQFASGNPMTRGAELGIVFSVSRTQRYLILFNRVDLESLEEDASSLGP